MEDKQFAGTLSWGKYGCPRDTLAMCSAVLNPMPELPPAHQCHCHDAEMHCFVVTESHHATGLCHDTRHERNIR